MVVVERLRITYDRAAVWVQARHLMTPLTSALTCTAEQPARDACAALASAGFTYAPVMRGDEVIGSVSTTDLEAAPDGPVSEVVRPLDVDLLVSGDITLPDLMGALSIEPFLYVLEGHRTVGFVLVADLNKHAARLHWYLLLAGFEIALADRIRAAYVPPERALESLSAARAEAVRERFRRLVEEDIELDEISTMDLVDLLRAARTAPGMLAELGFDNRSDWDRATQWLPGFRHTIMHPARSLLTSPSDVPDLLRKDAQLRRLAETV